MEATLLGKALTAVLAAAAFLYLLLLRPWRPQRMWARRVPAIDLLFLLGLVLGFSAIEGAPPFARVADLLVHQTDLPESLGEIDTRIRQVEQLPEQIWSDLTSRLGWTSEPPPPLPTGPGVVTEAVLPALTAIVEVLVRAFVYWGSLIVLATCQVMRLAVGIKRAIGARTPVWHTDPMLEVRLSELEETVLALRAIPEAPSAGP